MPRVAEAAVAKGIGWVISNSDVDYLKNLRGDPKVPAFAVTQGQREIGRIQGKQLAALLPQGGSVLYIEGPSTSSVAMQRHAGIEDATPSPTSSAQVSAVIGPTAGIVINRSTRSTNNESRSRERTRAL